MDGMDGWPAMETDGGRAVMKTPATKAQVCLFGLSTITCQRSTRSDLHALDGPTRIALISITYQSHIASKHSAAGKEVVRT